MAVTTVLIWEFSCDNPRSGCQMTLSVGRGDSISNNRTAYTKDDALDEARSQGWTIGQRTLCPAHARNR